MSQVKAHIASNEESQAKLKKLCSTIVESAPSELLRDYLFVLLENLRDRFNTVMVEHHEERKKNAVTSGIVDVTSERKKVAAQNCS